VSYCSMGDFLLLDIHPEGVVHNPAHHVVAPDIVGSNPRRSYHPVVASKPFLLKTFFVFPCISFPVKYSPVQVSSAVELNGTVNKEVSLSGFVNPHN